jgi:hypothetical protein
MGTTDPLQEILDRHRGGAGAAVPEGASAGRLAASGSDGPGGSSGEAPPPLIDPATVARLCDVALQAVGLIASAAATAEVLLTKHRASLNGQEADDRPAAGAPTLHQIPIEFD